MFSKNRANFIADVIAILISVGTVSYITARNIRQDFNKRSDDFKAQYDSDRQGTLARRVEIDKWRADLATQDSDISTLLATVSSHSGQMGEILSHLDAYGKNSDEAIRSMRTKIDAILAAQGIADPTTRPSTQPATRP